MAAETKIEWAHSTFNGWIGCTKVSPGCDHCYAETLATQRLGIAWGAGAARRRTVENNWREPIKWDRKAAAAGVRRRVFCSSLADVFDNEVPVEWRRDLGVLIDRTPNLDWLLLTKRIGNAAEMLADMFGGRVPANVWLGATVVNQAEADRDVPKLLATPAAKRFLSMEPLLGRVAFDPCDLAMLDWVIVGGESGPQARPMHPDWARDVRDQCSIAGVPFLFKQWGEWVVALDRERDDPDWRANYTNDYVDAGKSKWLNLAGGCGFHGERFHVMRRVGKKAAGRLLDGIQHDGVPA
jgi:protein gp37